MDDFIKDHEESESPLIREKTWEWYNSVFRTRKMDYTSSEIVVATRWHLDDLIGRLLSLEKDWVELKIPAILPDGNSFWESRFPLEYLKKLEKEV